MNDLIRRQDVIETLKKIRNKLLFNYILVCNIAIDKVNKIHSAWIPVSERLPEENEVVLTTIKGIKGILEDFVYSDCRYVNGIWETLVEANHDYWTEIDDVIAWMPYPEPYKENIDENH